MAMEPAKEAAMPRTVGGDTPARDGGARLVEPSLSQSRSVISRASFNLTRPHSMCPFKQLTDKACPDSSCPIPKRVSCAPNPKIKLVSPYFYSTKRKSDPSPPPLPHTSLSCSMPPVLLTKVGRLIGNVSRDRGSLMSLDPVRALHPSHIVHHSYL